ASPERLGPNTHPARLQDLNEDLDDKADAATLRRSATHVAPQDEARKKARLPGAPARQTCVNQRLLLAERIGKKEASVRPLAVETPGDAQGAQVALKDFRVIADGFDGQHGPVVAKAEHRSQAALLAQEAVDLGIFGGEAVHVSLV